MSRVEYRKYLPEVKDYIDFNGSSLDEFYRRAKVGRGADFYIKLYTKLVDWSFTKSTADKDFYVSTKGLQSYFNYITYETKDGKKVEEGYNNNYCAKTIQRAIRRLKRLKLVTVTFAPKKALREDPEEFVPHRVLKADMEKAKKLFNVYEPEQDRFINSYAMELATDEAKADVNIPEDKLGEVVTELYEMFKFWLKKIAQKRPYNYTEHADEKLKEYKEDGIAKDYKYTSVKEMIIYYKYKVASKYSNNNMFNKFIPRHLKDQQKEADLTLRRTAKPYGSLSEEDIVRIRTMNVPDAAAYVKRLIGYDIPTPELQKEAIKHFIKIDKRNHVVTGYDLDSAKYYADNRFNWKHEQLEDHNHQIDSQARIDAMMAELKAGWNEDDCNDNGGFTKL